MLALDQNGSRFAAAHRTILILVLLTLFGGWGSEDLANLSAGGAATHSVKLSWKASVSPDVTRYNVYRSTSRSGPFVKLTSTPVLGTSYTDTTVVARRTYYYVATSVTSKGKESRYSKMVRARVR